MVHPGLLELIIRRYSLLLCSWFFSLKNQIFSMNKFLIWNFRGVGNAPYLRRLKKLVKNHQVKLFVVLEPKVYNDDITAYQNKLQIHRFHSKSTKHNLDFFWKDMDCQVREVEEQYITISIHSASSHVMLICTYVSCDGRKRRELWHKLLNADINSEWLLAGDFNVVCSQDEKLGGNTINNTDVADFDKMIHQIALIDGGFSGSK